MKKVSVLMSIFNENELEIKKSIQSIITQSYRELELIIVIDNPLLKNEYIEIINKYFDDERVKILVNENNIGLAMSMNRAFKKSTGYYIARMDADDVASEKRIEKEVLHCEKNGCDIVCSGYISIDENDNIIDLDYKYYDDNVIRKKLITTNCIHHPTVLMRREVFSKVNGYRDYYCSQDYDLWLRILECGYKFSMIDEPLLKYRVRSNSVTNRKRFTQAITLYYINIMFYKRISEGIDCFSKEDYCAFLENADKKYKSFKENIRSIQDIQKKISGSGFLMRLIYMFVLFIWSKYIRDTYILKAKIKLKCVNHSILKK